MKKLLAIAFSVLFIGSLCSCDQEKEYEIGDTIKFGQYIQFDDSEKEPVTWVIRDIDETENKMLLLSTYVLDGQPYHSEMRDISYADCSLRAWLNNEFYNSCFSEEEKEQILDTPISIGETEITDKVFLPTLDEAIDYDYSASSTEPYRVRATKYAYIQGVRGFNSTHYKHPRRAQKNYYLYSNGDSYSRLHDYCDWWLRGSSLIYADIVNGWGEKDIVGVEFYVRNTIGVRPAIWIRIE